MSVNPNARSRKKFDRDDASYFGAPVPAVMTGTKRIASTSTLPGESERNLKRKRMLLDSYSEGRTMVNFTKLSPATVYRYLNHFELVPNIHPSPLTAEDPPPPLSLTDPRTLPLHPEPQTPIGADIDELHLVLASIAERHFRDMTITGREEVDTLASFMCAVEKGKVNRR
ncbi:hypothetical protein C8J56DRAFT_1170000 [Mycena floridula]|nr:hypothetical protein C8J56DRAFT_1170000 [Mycena floridula]